MFKRILFGYAGDRAGCDAAMLAEHCPVLVLPRGVEVAGASARAIVER